MERRLWGAQTSVVAVPRLNSWSSLALEHRFSDWLTLHRLAFSAACGIVSDQGSSPLLAGRFFTTEPEGKPPEVFI